MNEHCLEERAGNPGLFYSLRRCFLFVALKYKATPNSSLSNVRSFFGLSNSPEILVRQKADILHVCNRREQCFFAFFFFSSATHKKLH